MTIFISILTYRITKMDCPSEEMMIRQSLASICDGLSAPLELSFDLLGRTLSVAYLAKASESDQVSQQISDKIHALKLGDSLESTLYLHKYHISKMDCPSERSLIESALARFSAKTADNIQTDNIKTNDIEQLDFDLINRELLIHSHKLANLSAIAQRLDELKLGSQAVDCDEQMLTSINVTTDNAGSSSCYSSCGGGCNSSDESKNKQEQKQRKLLWQVLAINAVFFVLEVTTGLISDSMGLVADGLDMLADASVYGLSLFAVGATAIRQKQVAKWAGWLQIGLAILGLLEVIRRFIGLDAVPNFAIMMGVAFFALIANGTCLYLLNKSTVKQDNHAHMKASQIFTSNDVIINIGMIVSAGLVWWLGSPLPDLLIGCLVFIFVLNGARRILQLAK